MTIDLARDYPALNGEIVWGPVTSKFVLTAQPVDESTVSNVSIVPFSGGDCIMMRLDDGRWELPGGTLEQGEHYRQTLAREMREELGGELLSFGKFGHFLCESSAAAPYRPYIPHPRFVRLVVFGEVKLTGKPLNPPDGERVVAVEAMPIAQAVRTFQENGRFELAELYRLGQLMRSGGIHG